MAVEQPGFSLGHIEAGADYSAETNQYRCVKYGSGGTAGKAILASVAGEMVLGIMQNKPVAGAPVTIAIDWPLTKAVAGAAVALNALVMTDNVGRVVTATATNHAIGRAHSAAGAAGDIIMVQLFPVPYIVPA